MDSLMVNVIRWSNDNDGFLGLLLFFSTLAIGWFAGAFTALRSKPKLEIEVIDGPTFVCKVPTDRVFQEYDEYRAVVSLYLSVMNTGGAPTELGRVRVAYRSDMLLWQNSQWWKRFSHHEDRIERFRGLYRWLWIEGVEYRVVTSAAGLPGH